MRAGTRLVEAAGRQAVCLDGLADTGTGAYCVEPAI